jgi:phage protein U
MASVWIPSSADENKRRPHLCVATWGKTVQDFTCVIESISTKYTMFSEDGIPLRATCTVKLKEADVVARAQDSADGAAPESA